MDNPLGRELLPNSISLDHTQRTGAGREGAGWPFYTPLCLGHLLLLLLLFITQTLAGLEFCAGAILDVKVEAEKMKAYLSSQHFERLRQEEG